MTINSFRSFLRPRGLKSGREVGLLDKFLILKGESDSATSQIDLFFTRESAAIDRFNTLSVRRILA
jgi:hypothetical protein